MRFYDVTGGSIKLDGVNIQDFNPSYLRERIAWVGQEPLLFEGSVADNIRFGKPDATDDEVREAAIASQADEFISQSSEGYKLAVGIRGNKLSGGQKQRVAIARGLIKRAPILLMDEATSALDGKTEKKVKEAIDQRYANADDKPTMVIIAHRLSTIMNCDKIVVMELGEVVEEGSH